MPCPSHPGQVGERLLPNGSQVCIVQNVQSKQRKGLCAQLHSRVSLRYELFPIIDVYMPMKSTLFLLWPLALYKVGTIWAHEVAGVLEVVRPARRSQPALQIFNYGVRD